MSRSAARPDLEAPLPARSRLVASAWSRGLRVVGLACALLFVSGCPPTSPDAGPIADAGFGPDGGAEDDAGTGQPDAGEPADGGAPDAGPGVEVRQEVEPNDGAEVDEVDTLSVGERVAGAISSSGDVDIFEVPTAALSFVRVHLVTTGLDASSSLVGHLTVLDSGRDGDPAGADYVRISRTGNQSDVNLELFAMGDGHLVVVRDARNVDGQDVFGPELHYELFVEVVSDAATPVEPPTTINDALSYAGATRVYGFEAEFGVDALFTFSTAGEMDGRFFVVASETGSWIARNDDSGPADVDPRIDAPLFADGAMWLVVDNIQEDAANLAYELNLQLAP